MRRGQEQRRGPETAKLPRATPADCYIVGPGPDVFARGEASLALHLALQPASSRSRFPLRDDCGPVRLAVLRQPPTAPGDQQATGSDVVSWEPGRWSGPGAERRCGRACRCRGDPQPLWRALGGARGAHRLSSSRSDIFQPPALSVSLGARLPSCSVSVPRPLKQSGQEVPAQLYQGACHRSPTRVPRAVVGVDALSTTAGMGESVASTERFFGGCAGCEPRAW